MQKPLLSYGLSLAAILTAVLLRWLSNPLLGDALPFVTVFGAIAVAVWLGGYGPAAVAAMVGYVACTYLFVEPAGFDLSQPQNVAGLTAYLFTCALIIGFGQAARVAQRRLAEERERLRTTLASIGDAVISTDINGRVTSMNAVAELLTGWSCQEAIGEPLDSVFHVVNEETYERVESPAMRAIRQGTIVGLANHTLLIAKDGTNYCIDDSASPIRCKDGEVVGSVLIFRDITERRRLQRENEERAAAARFLASIVESSEDAILSKTLDGTIQSWNRAAERVFGYRVDEAVGRHISLIIPPERASEEEQIIARIRAGDRVEHFETVRLRRDSTPIDLSLMISPIKNEQGEIVGASKIARDITARKHFEERLRRSQESLSSLIELAPFGVYIVDSSFRIAMLNAGSQERAFRNVKPAVGRDFAEAIRILWPEPAATEIIGNFRRTLETGEPYYSKDYVQPRADIDEIESYEWELHRIALPDGQFGVVCYYYDTTELKVAEQALRAATAKFSSVFNQSGIFAGIMDLEGNLLEANDLSVEACGYTREQVLNRPFWEAPWWRGSEDIRQKIREATHQAAAGRVFREELTYWIEDGTERIVDFALHPIRDENGSVIYLHPTGIDITDQKQAEQSVRNRALQFETLLNQAPLGVYVVDADFRIREVNPIARPVFGDIPGGIEGQDFDEVMHILWEKDVADEIVEIFRHTLVTGEPYYIPEHAEQRRDRNVNEVYEWRLDRITLPEGRFGLVCYFREISAQVKAREALKDADRQKDEFLATLAHELRNPLAPIRNSLEVMKRADGDTELMSSSRCTIERQLGHLIRLVDDLIDISRISRNKIELRKEHVELASIIYQAVEASRPLADQAKQQVTVDLPPNPIYLYADPVRLTQVFCNLLNNASKYTEEKGRIQLSVVLQDHRAIVKVRDNGFGIAADKIGRIFDMFAQVDRTLERSQGGLGIGLTLVRRLVELHGGTISAHSDGLGYGAEFVVNLPILTGPLPQQMPKLSGEVKQTTRQRILVVDDNTDASSTLAMLLKLTGNDVETAHDGLAAIEAAERFRPDVMLLDIGLPKLNGYDACRRIREQPWGQDILLIAATGWGQEDDRRQSTEAGFDHHLVKPVDFATLTKLLEGATVA